MFHFPKYYIFIFVGLSVLTAYGIHRHQLKQSQGLTHGLNTVAGERKFASVPAEERDASAANISLESFEDMSSCGPERMHLESSLSQISPLFREQRSQSSTEFPRQCLTYMMRQTSETSAQAGRKWAYCQDSHSDLLNDQVSEFGSPCVTKNYVNSIYNFFGDVSDCLETPQRAQLPEIFTLSGGHINALGFNQEAGLAQLGTIPLNNANQEFQKFQKQILITKIWNSKFLKYRRSINF